MKLNTLLTAATVLGLTQTASAGDYIVRIEASVLSIDGAGSSVAPFSLAQPGDVMVVDYVVSYPGTPQPTILVVNGAAVPGVDYEIDYAASSLTLLGQQVPLEDTVPPPFEDRVSLASELNGVFGYAGAGSGFLSLTCWDFLIPAGALLPSNDLAQLVGTSYDPTAASFFFSPWLFYSDDFGLNPDGLALLVTGVSVVDFSGPVGTNYCQAAVNSTGASAVLSASGSTFVSDNDLTLTASRLPAMTFGFVLASESQGFTANPGGSAGNLCLSGAIGRYVGPGQIRNSGAAGTFSLPLDLMQTPTSAGFVSVAVGETWNYQAWYRDTSPLGTTSNFTDAVTVTFR